MRTHTRLTTPPGQEPVRVGDEGRTERDERYVHGLALPREPRVPGRFDRLLIVIAVLVALAVLGVGGWWVITSSQTFDPSLDNVPTQPGSPVPDGQDDPTLEVPTDA